MRVVFLAFVFAVPALLSATGPAAADTFRGAIRAGDGLVREKDYGKAIAAFETALKLATNDTDAVIALAKQGHVYAFHLKDYEPAREVAGEALARVGAHAVGRVTALRVMARVLMKADRDFAAAAELLEEARELDGVDWAQPAVALALGDCYRFDGDYDTAIEVYRSVPAMDAASDRAKAVAHLNTGITYQYHLRLPDAARVSYERALELNDKLKAEVDNHLAKLR